jgi:hypothetical protein
MVFIFESLLAESSYITIYKIRIWKLITKRKRCNGNDLRMSNGKILKKYLNMNLKGKQPRVKGKDVMKMKGEHGKKQRRNLAKAGGQVQMSKGEDYNKPFCSLPTCN